MLYGFTQDPNTLDYMIVMDYITDGSLRKNLSNVVKDKWKNKLVFLFSIITGLEAIYQQNLIHRDLHDGNILGYTPPQISNLGLC